MVRHAVESDEQAQGVIERFKRRAGLVDSMPGFKGFELLKGENELISMTRWATRADLDRWMESQAHAQAHTNIQGAGGSASPASSDTATPSGTHTPPTAPAHASHGEHQHGSARPQTGMGANVSIYEIAIPGESQA
jgi:heme-degrading monooxygenase HmoA